MKTQGVTWNAVVTDEFDTTVAFFKETLGLSAGVEFPGFAMFPQTDGGILEVYAEGNTPEYGFNNGVVFGFRVGDIEAASAELVASGVELLGEINRLDTGYAYRHFRGPEGTVYGLNGDPQDSTTGN